jgi:transcriptional regulator with GAF, ATPase, and Fis domain
MDVLTKIGVVLALLVALFFGEQYIEGLGYDRRASEDAAAMAQQKQQATAKLAELTQDKLTALAALANLNSDLEKTREKLQSKNAADLRARTAGPGLRFTTQAAATGCGGGGGSTTSPAPAPDIMVS